MAKRVLVFLLMLFFSAGLNASSYIREYTYRANETLGKMSNGVIGRLMFHIVRSAC
jgi:hypothetical protein